jgi:hypothetical protein
MRDADLAELYGVSTKALNQAVKRNTRRFPQDFMFQLTQAEKLEVVTNCGHLATLKFSKSLPLAFTEHGAIQVANLLNSEQAVDRGVYIVRAFVYLREMSTTNKELALRLDDLENKSELMSTHGMGSGPATRHLGTYRRAWGQVRAPRAWGQVRQPAISELIACRAWGQVRQPAISELICQSEVIGLGPQIAPKKHCLRGMGSGPAQGMGSGPGMQRHGVYHRNCRVTAPSSWSML